MKKFGLLSVLTLLILSVGMKAQTPQAGTVEFEEIRKFEFNLEGEMAQMMKDMPSEQKSAMILYFSTEASLYEKVKGEETMMGGGFAHAEAGINIIMSAPDNKVFIDLVKNEILEQKEFMTRTFLIKEDMPENKWKITGEQKMILDYPCMEATVTDTAGVTTSVWFTPAIPVKSGPLTFCNLPGLVLEADINDGSHKFIAKSINLDLPDEEKLMKPKDGKKVTKEEYDIIVAEKMKEMGVENGGSGNTIVIRVNKN